MIPNPYLLLGVGAAFVALAAVAGVQTYRLQGAQGTISIYKLKEAEALKAEQLAALHRMRNKERTDAQYSTDLAVAHAAGLRVNQPAGGTFVKPTAGSGSDATACFNIAELNEGLAAWAERLVARIKRPAQQAEAIVAAYNACRNWALSANPTAVPSTPAGTPP